MRRNAVKNVVLVAIVIALAAFPLLTMRNAEFAGADSSAQKAITEIDPGYKQWFSPIFEPKSSEVQSFLFALQAAAGSGVLFFCLGYMKGKSSVKEVIKDDEH